MWLGGSSPAPPRTAHRQHDLTSHFSATAHGRWGMVTGEDSCPPSQKPQHLKTEAVREPVPTRQALTLRVSVAQG